MGEALLGGILDARWADPAEIVVVERLTDRCDELRALFPGVVVTDSVVASDGAVIAVKPADVPDTCRALAAAGVNRVLSIAAGVTLATLQDACGPDVAVVRAMPNTPAVVRAGAAAIAPGASASEDDLDWASSILDAVGVVVRVPEDKLDAVTGLSGSGPAYVFYLTECLAAAGEKIGLPKALATQLARATVAGSGELMRQSGTDAGVLRQNVTSPKGTTYEALQVLMAEDTGMGPLFEKAVAAALRRSRELAS